MSAYYNEHDPKAAAWLRELVRSGHIAAGDVDERSIEDVLPGDLDGYTQCHFFAGIGGWSLALRLAGWPDDAPVWTGSCPCQPFSAAGKGRGAADERHLWPAFKWLLEQCRPAVCFGEQVASPAGRGWLAGVFADVEELGYQRAGADLCAAGIGAPHIRQRLFWVAYADGGNARAERLQRGGQHGQQPENGGDVRLADAASSRRAGPVEDAEGETRDQARVRLPEPDGGHGRMEHTKSGGTLPAEQRRSVSSPEFTSEVGRMGDAHDAGPQGRGSKLSRRGGEQQLAESGFWSAYDLLWCLDGKSRRIEPGTFPLAHGVPARVGRLRGYGNAIVPQLAAEFIRCAQDALSLKGH